MKDQMIFFLVCALLLGSCTDFLFYGNSDSSTDNISKMTLEEVAKKIDQHVGQAPADRVSQCSILPIGAKPCGGPWGFLVYSKKESSETTLKKLIERYDELDEIRNIEEGRASTCDVAQPPDFTLENGFCKGEGPYAWNPGQILKWNGIEE